MITIKEAREVYERRYGANKKRQFGSEKRARASLESVGFRKIGERVFRKGRDTAWINYIDDMVPTASALVHARGDKPLPAKVERCWLVSFA